MYFWQSIRYFCNMRTIVIYDIRLFGFAMHKRWMSVYEEYTHVSRYVIDMW